MEDLRVLFFFYIIQALLMTIASILFFDLNVRKTQIILVAILYGGAIWGIRSLYSYYKIPYGTHTLVLAVIHCIILYGILKLNVIHCLALTGFSFSLVMLGGGLVGVGVNWSGITIDMVLRNVWLKIIFGHLENVFLIVYLILYKATNFSLKKMVKETNE